jgi:UDP-N-acetylglucosamine--dolichyl-phosphate N-acetylglucosaminephosphotransferase
MAYPVQLLVFLAMLVSFLVTLKTTPTISKWLVKAGIVGRDVHKKNKPVLAEMGGLSIAVGIIFGFSVAIALLKNFVELDILFGAFTCILLITLVGIADDIFQLPQVVKASLPLLAALPLMAIREGVRTLSIPLIGPVDFGVLYPFLLIPLGITGAANATNMLAGINGLETGMGIVMHATVLAISLIVLPFSPFAIYSAIISGIVLGSLIAFLLFNRYPARVFPGDVGTLVIGGALGASVILGNMEKIGVILIFPYFIELGLKALTKFKGASFGKLRSDGTLEAPAGRPASLTHVAMKLGRFKEGQIALVLVGMELIFAALSFLSVWLTYFAK